MEKFTFTVSSDEAGIPLKKIIKAKYHFSSRLMTKIKYQDLLSLNGKKVPGYTVPLEGDTVAINIPDEISGFMPEDIPIKVIYEDDDLLVINKDPGITCHPTKGHPDHTIANGIMKYMGDTHQSFKIRFINRLDMDTSGVLILGKNSHAQAELNKEMSSGLTEKHYFSIVSGLMDIKDILTKDGILKTESGFLIDLPILKPEMGSKKRTAGSFGSLDGYPSQTEVEILGTGNINTSFKNNSKNDTLDLSKMNLSEGLPVTYLKIKLLTGRTHQIRVHLSHLGYPILGDPLYGGNQEIITRQALHALNFKCLHPITGEALNFRADIPEDIKNLIEIPLTL